MNKIDHDTKTVLNYTFSPPKDVALMLAKKLDLPALVNLRLSSKFWGDIGKNSQIWTPIAEVIGCPLAGDSPVMDQVVEFIRNLLKIAPELIRGPHVDRSLVDETAPTIDRVKQLHTLMNAYSIHKVWSKLHIELNLIQGNFDELMDPDHFDPWLVAFQNELASLTTLDLSNCQLTHFPKQLCNLAGLQELNLKNNLLLDLPPELCNLTGLTTLHLGNNSLRPSTATTFKLPPNLILSKKFLESLPREFDLQIADQLGFPVQLMKTLRERTWNYISFEINDILKSKKPIPAEIKDLIHKRDQLSVSEVQYFLKWRKALDTLLIWSDLASLLKPGASHREIFGFENFFQEEVSLQIAVAEGFQEWFLTHKDELARYHSLPFLYKNLELPKELMDPAFFGKLEFKSLSFAQEGMLELSSNFIGSPDLRLEDFIAILMHSAMAQDDIPDHIKSLCGNRDITLNQIKELHDWLKARSIINFWLMLGHQLENKPFNGEADEKTVMRTLGVRKSSFNNSKGEINLATHFHEWFEKHRAQLIQLESLNLSSLKLKLIYLPEEIGLLTGLKHLNLGGIQLITLPKEILKLSKLEELFCEDPHFWNKKILVELLQELLTLSNLKKLGLGSHSTRLLKDLLGIRDSHYDMINEKQDFCYNKYEDRFIRISDEEKRVIKENGIELNRAMAPLLTNLAQIFKTRSKN